MFHVFTFFGCLRLISIIICSHCSDDVLSYNTTPLAATIKYTVCCRDDASMFYWIPFIFPSELSDLELLINIVNF